MKYFIQRQLNEYGPYTLADLQRYVAQGNIALTDLTRSEGMTEWVPVSQVIGNIPVPAPGVMPAPGMQAQSMQAQSMPAYGGGTVYQATAPGYATPPQLGTPIPPDFHWALVLLIGIVTCGIFTSVWLIVEAAWLKKIRPQSNAIIYMILSVVGLYAGRFMVGFYTRSNPDPLGLLILLSSIVVYFVAVFSIRSELEEYYNSAEPINLQLSGVMTFFFAVYYFQHHFSRIARWRKTGVLQPQG